MSNSADQEPSELECLAIYQQAQMDVAAARGLPDPTLDRDYAHHGGDKPTRASSASTMRSPQALAKSVEELARDILASAGVSIPPELSEGGERR